MGYKEVPSTVFTAFQVQDPANATGTPYFYTDITGVYSNGVLVGTGAANAVFGPGSPTVNGLPVWQDPDEPGSLGDTLVNTPVSIDPITGNTNGIGSLATSGAITINSVPVNPYNPVVSGLTDAGTIAWNVSSHPFASILLTAGVGATRILGFPTGVTASQGGYYTLKVIQSSAGNNALTFASGYVFPGGITPLLSVGANAVDYLPFYYDGTNMVLANILKGVAA